MREALNRVSSHVRHPSWLVLQRWRLPRCPFDWLTSAAAQQPAASNQQPATSSSSIVIIGSGTVITCCGMADRWCGRWGEGLSRRHPGFRVFETVTAVTAGRAVLGAATDFGALTTKVSLSVLPSWGLVSGNICSARVVVCEYVGAYMCAPLSK